MTEMTLTWLAGVKLLIAALIGLLYSLAGRGVGIKRRLYLPIILAVNWIVFMFLMGKFSLMLLGAILLSIPLYYLTMSVFSYGADSWIRKLIGRIPQQFIVGGVHGASAILVAIVTGSWGVYSLCVLCPMVTLGALGGWADGDLNASYKEAVCGISIFLCPLFMV